MLRKVDKVYTYARNSIVSESHRGDAGGLLAWAGQASTHGEDIRGATAGGPSSLDRQRRMYTAPAWKADVSVWFPLMPIALLAS